MVGNGHESSKPTGIVLWGLGAYAEPYLACLRDARIDVALCVDGPRAGGSVGGIPVVSPEECARHVYRYAHLPVVVTTTAPDGADGFNDAARSIACELDLPMKVIHPVFLARHLDLDYGGNVVLAGFPEAGDTVVRPILRRLLERRRAAPGAREALFTRLAREYHVHTLMPALDDLFDLGGRFASRGFTVEADRIRVEMRLSHARRAMLCNLRSPTFLHQRLHPTHERLTDATVGRFRRMHWTIVAVVRHPIDVLVANAIRLAREPGAILANLDWFRNMAVLVKDYYGGVLDQGSRVWRPYATKICCTRPRGPSADSLRWSASRLGWRRPARSGTRWVCGRRRSTAASGATDTGRR